MMTTGNAESVQAVIRLLGFAGGRVNP